MHACRSTLEDPTTYVEPFARVMTGALTPAQVWSDVVRDLPKGLPAKGDRGLDHTATWGRTYWGGALFCLLADVGIRGKTGNRKGLRDALAGIVAGGGSIASNWDLPTALAMGDKAVGVAVLQPLYAAMKDSPHPVDLAALWKRLGIVAHPSGTVTFDDTAPAAAMRRGIEGR